MKSYELLESISCVDEALLMECEGAKYTRKPTAYKFLLAAAIVALLSVTAFGASRLFVDVDGGEIVPHTFQMQSLDAQWNVAYEAEREGYILTAQIDTYEDAPINLVKPYLPRVPENWECAGAANAKYDGKLGMIGVTWTYEENGQAYEVFYRQESAYSYNHRGDGEVWWITDVPDDVTMTGKNIKIGDAPVYQVDVSASTHTWGYPAYAHRMIFWSDGYSIFQLRVPQYWSSERVFELMCSLTLHEDIETVIGNLQ